MDATQTTLDKLMKIRERKDVTIRPTPLLRKTVMTLDGTEKALSLRYYQVQMVLHLLSMRRFIVGDDTGLGKCVTRDTLIETNRGLVPIGDLQPSQHMWPDTFEPVKGWTVRVGDDVAPVKSFYYSGFKPTRRVRTHYGFEVEGSLVHPLYVRTGNGEEWRQLRNLEGGYYVCIDRRGTFPAEEPPLTVPVIGAQVAAHAQSFPVPGRMTPRLARLLGYIVGEGWANNRYTLQVSQSKSVNPETHQDIRTLIREVLGYEVSDQDTMGVNSIFIRKYLEYMGVDYTTSRHKRVPSAVLRATRESVREFLRGLFEGEGSAVGGGVEFTTSSKQMAREVQVLLLRFGIVAKRSPRRVKGYDHTYWRLTLFGDDARVFATDIGFVSERKQGALFASLPKKSNPNHDIVPYMRLPVERLREEITSRVPRGISTRWGSAFYNTLGHVRGLRRDPSYEFLRKLLGVAAEVGVPLDHPDVVALHNVVERRFFYDKVEDVQEGFAEVVDLEVDHPGHAFVGNGLVNHNTLESIASLCYVWEREPDCKVLVLTKKSTVRQWVDEFKRFTTGVTVIVCKGTPKQRATALAVYEASTGPSVLVMGHRSAVQDFSHIQDKEWGVFVLDEATIAKTPSTQIHQVCRHLSAKAKRAWGLTATLIKNNLIEGYGIFKCIEPALFPQTLNAFIDDYCVTQLINVGRGRKVKQVVGYRKASIQIFRQKIEPYYLGRPKHQVASELPPLTSRRIRVGMSPVQNAKYQEALAGLLEIGTGEEKEVSKLTAVTYCQEIVNHPMLIGINGDSEKLDELLDILTEGDLAGEKVIVFTRFEKMVGIGIEACEKANVRCVRITGKEDEDERKTAQDVFQDINSGVPVVWITTAGSEAINLQAAKAIVFYDTPFSAGDYLQTLGRMIRIGSIHDRVFAIHLVAEDSIDERVMDIMDGKMGLLEAVLGKRIKGEDENEDEVIGADKGSIDALFDSLTAAARGLIRA